MRNSTLLLAAATSLLIAGCGNSTAGHGTHAHAVGTPSMTVPTQLSSAAAPSPTPSASHTSSAEAVTQSELLSGWVPALRGNPAQHLVDGKIAHPSLNGAGGLELSGGGAPAFGDVTGDGVPDAVATVRATSGAGGSGDYLELYTNGGHWLGQFDPSSVMSREHGQVLAMIIRDERVLVDWLSGTGADSDFVYWSAQLRWDGQRFIASDVARHTGQTDSGLIADPSLTLTGRGLGALRLGLNSQQLAAIGVLIGGGGDGAVDAAGLPAGYNAIYFHGINLNTDQGHITCVGIRGNRSAPNQRIATPEGFQLGDTVGRLKQLYGSRARYVPAPAGGGLDPQNGYVIDTDGGEIVLAWSDPTPTVDPAPPDTQRITEMFAATAGTPPSFCNS